MPNSLITRRSIRLLTFAYASALTVLLFLLISGQTIIQMTLSQEIHERAVAAQIDQQELRTQRMYNKALFLQNPKGSGTNYTALYHAVEADEPTWERVQHALYSGDAGLGISPADFSPSVFSIVTKEEPGYLLMQAAYRHALLLEQRDHPASPDTVRPDIVTIYLQEPAYLQSLVTLYTGFSAQADSQVAFIRTTEAVLFVLALLVLCAEVLFVVRPALWQLHQRLDTIAAIMARAEQERQDQGGTPPEPEPPGPQAAKEVKEE